MQEKCLHEAGSSVSGCGEACEGRSISTCCLTIKARFFSLNGCQKDGKSGSQVLMPADADSNT